LGAGVVAATGAVADVRLCVRVVMTDNLWGLQESRVIMADFTRDDDLKKPRQMKIEQNTEANPSEG
jgi:hypothetical protein